MAIPIKYLLLLVCICLFFSLSSSLGDEKKSVSPDNALFGNPRLVGQLGDDRLVECSGMDTSLAVDDLIWAVNDNGHGPFLYALRTE